MLPHSTALSNAEVVAFLYNRCEIIAFVVLGNRLWRRFTKMSKEIEFWDQDFRAALRSFPLHNRNRLTNCMPSTLNSSASCGQLANLTKALYAQLHSNATLASLCQGDSLLESTTSSL